mmetsp:Transcript_11006/g.16644  ORF Transcript_11006/g.16644 Transcript_11006/m.16644 type:complete len:84 (-) Transcript_11006:5291-5542(-)
MVREYLVVGLRLPRMVGTLVIEMSVVGATVPVGDNVGEVPDAEVGLGLSELEIMVGAIVKLLLISKLGVRLGSKDASVAFADG